MTLSCLSLATLQRSIGIRTHLGCVPCIACQNSFLTLLAIEGVIEPQVCRRLSDHAYLAAYHFALSQNTRHAHRKATHQSTGPERAPEFEYHSHSAQEWPI